MPTMPEDLSKGDILKRLDAVLSDPAKRRVLSRELKATPLKGLVGLAVTHGIVQSGSSEEKHLRDDWFGPNWWTAADSHGNPGMQPADKEELVRAAMIVACEEATRTRLPVDTYWICRPAYGGGNKLLEASVSWSGAQVTLLLITPPPPNQPAPAWGDPIKFIEMDAAGQTTATNCMDGSQRVLFP